MRDAFPGAATPAAQPNIIFILADDLDSDDVSAFFKTPAALPVTAPHTPRPGSTASPLRA